MINTSIEVILWYTLNTIREVYKTSPGANNDKESGISLNGGASHGYGAKSTGPGRFGRAG